MVNARHNGPGCRRWGRRRCQCSHGLAYRGLVWFTIGIVLLILVYFCGTIGYVFNYFGCTFKGVILGFFFSTTRVMYSFRHIQGITMFWFIITRCLLGFLHTFFQLYWGARDRMSFVRQGVYVFSWYITRGFCYLFNTFTMFCKRGQYFFVYQRFLGYNRGLQGPLLYAHAGTSYQGTRSFFRLFHIGFCTLFLHLVWRICAGGCVAHCFRNLRSRVWVTLGTSHITCGSCNIVPLELRGFAYVFLFFKI